MLLLLFDFKFSNSEGTWDAAVIMNKWEEAEVMLFQFFQQRVLRFEQESGEHDTFKVFPSSSLPPHFYCFFFKTELIWRILLC